MKSIRLVIATILLFGAPGAVFGQLKVTTGGDLGLHTETPVDDFHIEGTTGMDRALFRMQAGRNVGFVLKDTNLSAEWSFGTAKVTGDFNIALTGSGRRMTVTQSGNIDIPGSFISGGTTLNVPDYVFDPEYDLMPLADLSEFIKAEGHLPNIPSASDVAASGGINLTQLQLSLLEKVEELTLYTLKQQELIEAQDAALQEALARLETMAASDTKR